MIDFNNATTEELLIVAHEDDSASVMDKAYALIQLDHRQEQIDLYDYIRI